MQIYDSTGMGYGLSVDKYNRARTFSVSVPEISFISQRNDDAYIITAENITFNSLEEHPIYYLRNDDPEKCLILSSVIYSFNGGNTTFNRKMLKKVYKKTRRSGLA